ncbi:hypothetical protein CR513_18762, partial [Mucuna pruriens]
MTRCPSEMNSQMSNYCISPCLHHGLQTSVTLWQHLSSHWRHLGYTEKDFKMMPSTTYGMIPTFGNFIMIKSLVGAFLTSRSTRSSNFVMQHLEAATMVLLGQPGRYLIAGSIGPPFSKTPINLSPPTINVKKLEWPLAEGMKCPNNPYCFAKWVEDITTKTNDAKVVVDFLKSNIFYWFGVPKVLISDQGSHFCNIAMSSLLHKYGVSQLLEDALWAHKTAYRTPLGMSPYWIVFSKACHLLKVKQFHDQQILRKQFRASQKVLLFNSRLKLIAGKLRSRWDGPFVITNAFPYGIVELKDEHTNNTFQVNGHQIKLYHEGPAPIAGDMETISLMEPAPPDNRP